VTGAEAELGAATGTRRIADAFAASGKRAALMPYLMGGFPDLETSRAAGEAFADAGADLIEVGIPFSDPLADGPVIQAAGQRALEAGATFDGVIDAVAAPLAARLPVIVMCYANPLLARGAEAVADRLAAAGIAGLVVPDLPAEEARELRDVCDRAGVALVPLLAPTTPPDDVAAIARAARGFVYLVSVTGVTGERSELPPDLERVAAAARKAADVPVAIGFGVATVAQVERVGAAADGVIVGSRLVRAIADTADAAAGVASAAAFVREAAAALA
jgi:tryptophan synthase alpha chain